MSVREGFCVSSIPAGMPGNPSLPPPFERETLSARNPWGACPRAHAFKIELRGGRGPTSSQSAWQSGGIVPWGNKESSRMWSAATPPERGPKNSPPRRGVAEDLFPGRSLARPAGVPSRGAAFRGCRFAQPPATFWDASGIGSSPAAGSSRSIRCVSPGA
jgi:hypothetical protein